jgi:hypothetical protein
MKAPAGAAAAQSFDSLIDVAIRICRSGAAAFQPLRPSTADGRSGAEMTGEPDLPCGRDRGSATPVRLPEFAARSLLETVGDGPAKGWPTLI